MDSRRRRAATHPGAAHHLDFIGQSGQPVVTYGHRYLANRKLTSCHGRPQEEDLQGQEP